MELALNSSAPAGALIDKLPAELIERILLEVSTHVVSPVNDGTSQDINSANLSKVDHSSPSSDNYTIPSTAYSGPGDDDYTVPNIVDDGLPSLLDFRLTCRTFQNFSWRALAAKLGETRFDLRSRQSFSNLMTVASCKHLAPWITKLTIACHATHEKYPYAYSGESIPAAVDRMDKSLFEELLRIKQDEETWYPGIWERWPETSLEIPGRDVPLERYQQVDTRLLEKTLASALQSFGNLNHIRYVYEPDTHPGRYYKCPRLQGPQFDYQSSLHFSFGSGCYSGYIAHVGLEILIRAMASSGAAVRTMDLAVDLAEHHAFITHVPADVFANVSRKVETLVLRDCYCPFYDDDDGIKEPRILITNSVFPSLRHLTIDHNGPVAVYDRIVTPLPSPSNLPSLMSLSIANTQTEQSQFLSFIRNYGTHAQCITFTNTLYPFFEGLLKAICEFGLEELRIHHKIFCEGSLTSSIHREITNGMTEDGLHKAASMVVISPPGLRDALEKQWKLDRRWKQRVQNSDWDFAEDEV